MDIWSKLSSGFTLINIEAVASGLTANLVLLSKNHHPHHCLDMKASSYTVLVV